MVQRVGTEWNEVMAANLLVMLPVLIVYFFAQDKLIGGIANVGIKG
jgi:multiple sugar transport system permease protein